MNPVLADLITHTEAVMAGNLNGYRAEAGRVHVGVDLGTAYTVLLVLNEQHQPVAGAYEFAQVVRDGLVVDFMGAVDLLMKLKRQAEAQLGFELHSAASAYPPGVPQAEVRATANVLRAVGLECTGLIDEPSAANNVLKIHSGAIVDVGGGTTGVAIVQNGQVVATADEATGGTHFSLVIAGAGNLTFEQAEALKKNPREQSRLFPVVRPVMEKVANIVRRSIAGHAVEKIYLVGGTCAYPGMAQVIEDYVGVPTILPGSPLFITPLGIAMHNQ